MKWILVFTFITVIGSQSFGEIINVPEDFETIKAGIDAAENGDSVIVVPGEYIENINFEGKAIAVIGHPEDPGEAFKLRLWDANLDQEFVINHMSTLDGDGLISEPDGLSVLEMAIEATTPDDFFLSEAYPNPFNAMVRLDYG
ncbi:MAG: hypothetical protein HN356_03780 [Calditrichaeota bacterium]|jgi:hypothetical protein|nr:hypothetical protein [Calditrichota bacterium]MBT7615817.1 hypothetical protein [Calditrichota bacterium]MBT7790330.1 hypothetical protein [Calditrichota bacterium]